MTEDEKRRQKQQVLLDFHEAVENLKAIRQKIKDNANELDAVAEWLRTTNRAVIGFDPNASFWATSLARHAQIDEPRFKTVMNLEDHMELLGQFDASLKRVEELRQTKQELGLGST